MPTEVLLVRHGQTDSNVTRLYMGWSQEDLNETGYSQAERLAQRLADVPISALFQAFEKGTPHSRSTPTGFA